MPIYEYQCSKCGKHTEIIQKFSDPPISKCDACNGKMKKLISQSTFHLKGTGWYVTDYASKSSGSKATSGLSTPNSDSAQKQDKTSDSMADCRYKGQYKNHDHSVLRPLGIKTKP